MATYKTLSSKLNWANGLPEASTTMIVAGGLEADGSVMIPHLVNSVFERQGQVILLSFRHPFNHYLHIMRKMGVNASKHKLQFVNGLVETDLSSLPPATRPHFTLSADWQEFYSWLNAQPPSLLIIDGLCSLLDLGHDVKTVMSFFTACQQIVGDWSVRAGGGYAGLVANMLLDEFTELLAKSLIRRSHYFFNFEDLESGASTDVSGQLTAIPGHLHCQIQNSGNKFKPALLHYKVADTTVQFFSPGQSSTIL
ncbi:Elongator subunit elp6 [Coemansia guatemalensis]|uniref:Elongator subunit elp6 n=1 Tax=Coemansia guatemalensis TaxID=2761395 RepID=A0A9W8HZH6_9FUNG|nr:Elongator subunit elp6 [Coemansia guatemalensis]